MAPGSFEESISNHIKQQKGGDKIMSGVLFALSHWALSQFQVFSVFVFVNVANRVLLL